MNSHDAYHWTKGLEKLDAGTPERLTDAEREVLTYFGGETVLHPTPRVLPARLSTKARVQIHTTSIAGSSLHTAGIAGTVKFSGGVTP